MLKHRLLDAAIDFLVRKRRLGRGSFTGRHGGGSAQKASGNWEWIDDRAITSVFVHKNSMKLSHRNPF
jgi:hypothetical protein